MATVAKILPQPQRLAAGAAAHGGRRGLQDEGSQRRSRCARARVHLTDRHRECGRAAAAA
eukprot:6421788-Prymnesium_polylepis.1